MSNSPAFRLRRICRLTSLALISSFFSASLFAENEVVSVFTKTANGYARVRHADGTYQPETYAFAPGGRLDGVVNDNSVDKLTFSQVAGVVAASLKRQNYVATTDPRQAGLLIFVSWGTTSGTDEGQYREGMTNLGEAFRAMNNVPQLAVGQAATVDGIEVQKMLDAAAASQMDGVFSLIALENASRDRNNNFNADVLGYTTELRDARFLNMYSVTARDVIAEVEESRYFVVLKAYDFQKLRNKQGKTLLWEARDSIRRHGARFDEQLVNMTRYASQFFGQDLGRLIRRPLREGTVELGTPKVVEQPK